MTSLPPEFENYEAIKKRHEVLGEFVKYTETIQWQDSLLQMASMDTSRLRARIDSVFAAKEKKEDTRKKRRKRSEGGTGQSGTFYQTESTSTTDWYFGNASAVASGQSEFQRIWGSIALEDNWRRSTKSAVAPTVTETASGGKQEAGVSASERGGAGPPNPAKDAATRIFAELPKTEDQKKEALAKIEESYFKLGDLYYFQLEEKDNAEGSYEKLLERFPSSKFKPEVLYKLYLIHKEKGDSLSEVLAKNLATEFPNSTYTKILLNPNYLKETSVTQEKQKMIYKEAYAEFQKNNLRLTQEKIKQAQSMGQTAFSPQLELLQILITGKTEDVTRYQYELGEFIKKYPDAPVHSYAETLLASSKTFIERSERSRGIRFVASFEEPHYFVIVHRYQDRASTAIATLVENFNRSNYRQKKLETTNLIYSEDYALTFAGDFQNRADAMEYFTRFNAQTTNQQPLSTLKFHNFVITKDNFNIFYRNKALDEYLSFFDRYYQKENQ